MFLPHMSMSGAAWTGLLGTSLSTAFGAGGVHSPNFSVLPPSLSLLRDVFNTGRHIAWLTEHHPPAQGVSRSVDRKPTWWLSTFALAPLRLPPSSRITSLCRRRGGRANAFPIQSPVRDGRLGLRGVGVSHCKAEPPTACTGINGASLADIGAFGSQIQVPELGTIPKDGQAFGDGVGISLSTE
ncbi:hypothetical protein GSI_11757 [Ganoderma sinense ZZ0214-1]|uniref:Secreted protein n=1 Tax=Ganoderma sinense ZZ0214-1 TaxID=1077348 RepID=A0A2G8RWW3_9APHY|nr:hypothetical protein GSI_11757 [Ganoderma sinense ZZ0214-1]